MNRNVLHTRPSKLLLSLAIVCTACAREEMPPGTGPDFEAPVVVEMFPAHGSSVPDIDGHAYVKFDEPLGDPRSLARQIETSPAWLYEIKAGRSDVRIRPLDGWRPGVVYTFRIPPGLRDLVRNQTREPIEVLFTTGAEFVDSRTTGAVWDRETVRKARDILVHVVGGDSVPYSAVTDTGGSFALAGLPTGDYWAFAFQDQNRNRTLEREFEPHDSSRVNLSDSALVAELELWLTAPDSTAPLLALAQARDSLTLRLEFDDLLEPDVPLADAAVRVSDAVTGEEWPVMEFVVGDLAATVDSVAAGEEPETGRQPTDAERAEEPARPEPVPVEAPPLRSPSDSGAVAPPEEVRSRPQRFASVRLGRPFAAGSYRVSARGFVNLRGLAGGGDTTFVYEPPVVAPEEEVEESGAVPSDPEADGSTGTEEGR